MKQFLRPCVILALCSLFVLTSCTPEGSRLDRELEKLLDSQPPSNGRMGKFAFLLPESHDYSRIPQDPRNPLNSHKVVLGQLLFHETGLGIDPKVAKGLKTFSCASCHHANAGFQAGIAQGIGEGGIGYGARGEGRSLDPDYAHDKVDVQPIRTPSAMNAAFQPLMLWNGQFGAVAANEGTQANWAPGTPKEKNWLGFHGIETQAIAGQGVHRMLVLPDTLKAKILYRYLFDNAFPELPPNERISQVSCGLAIAAYERTLLSNQAPFQQWLRGDYAAMNDAQKEGAVLFFGKAGCGSCHQGPALNSMDFYAYGMNDLLEGNYGAINSTPDKAEHRGRGGFTGRREDMYKFKVPQLYNLKDSPFYGHGASFTSIRDVVAYKNRGIPQNSNVPASQLAPHFSPLGLTDDEVAKIAAFLSDALYDPNLSRYEPASLPTGLCFPNNDPQSRLDRRCD